MCYESQSVVDAPNMNQRYEICTASGGRHPLSLFRPFPLRLHGVGHPQVYSLRVSDISDHKNVRDQQWQAI